MTRTFSCPAPAIVRGIARVIHGIALVLASLLAAPEALAGAIVVGVLLWNIDDRTDAARAVLTEDGPVDRDALIGRIREEVS